MHRHELVAFALTQYYAADDARMRTVAPYVRGDAKRCSLRMLDWFVTSYSRRMGTVIVPTRGDLKSPVHVHVAYRTQLKSFSKQLFDPFRRRNRLLFEDAEGCELETTVGQLNFFRWAIECELLEYVEAHAAEIDADMRAAAEQRGARRDNYTAPVEPAYYAGARKMTFN